LATVRRKQKLGFVAALQISHGWENAAQKRGHDYALRKTCDAG
jgi:hypothetical protein